MKTNTLIVIYYFLVFSFLVKNRIYNLLRKFIFLFLVVNL